MIPSARETTPRATAIGATALLMWATLAWLATETARLPAFQLMGIAFAVAFALALSKWWRSGEPVWPRLKLPPRLWALGLFGIFGYHALFFVALRAAPAAEANLINYLWPLLLALGSSLLPGERLRWWHGAGCALGFFGAALLAGSSGFAFQSSAWAGYAAALGCAVIWPTYSILSRHLAKVSSDTVGAFCGGTALLSLLLHWGTEQWVAPSAGEWMALVAIGVGPVGVALFTWDVGMKRGNVRALAATSYLEPLFSTAVLLSFGTGQWTWPLALACGLIVAGAITGGWDMVGGQRERAGA